MSNEGDSIEYNAYYQNITIFIQPMDWKEQAVQLSQVFSIV